MRLSGVTVAWRGTPNLDDWVAYIVNGTRSKKLILADHASERKVKTLISRCASRRALGSSLSAPPVFASGSCCS